MACEAVLRSPELGANGMRRSFLNRSSALRRIILPAAIVAVLTQGVSCKQRFFNAQEDSDLQTTPRVRFDREQLLKTNRFDQITPTGERIFAASVQWMRDQENEADIFARPAQCANNVSRVLEMAGITAYSSPLLTDVVASAQRRGGLVITLPKETRSIAQVLESKFAGSLPVGTLVSGCLRADCRGDAGDGHISIVGDLDANGHIQLYHNNWYRPENRPWRPYMIPLWWYQLGYTRKWMPTPWLGRQRDSRGGLTDVGVVLPEIDDLDPTNYFLTLTIIPEILAEMRAGQQLVTDGAGSIMPLPRRDTEQLSESMVAQFSPVNCKNLKTVSAFPTSLRDRPSGKLFCRLSPGSPLERMAVEGNWTQAKGVCSDGRIGVGYVSSALVVPACE